MTKGATVPPVPLPNNPSIEHLKKQAKMLQDLVREGDEGAMNLVREFHPRHAAVTTNQTRFKRTDAQLVVARHYGFSSWTKLRDHLALVSRYGRSPLDTAAAGQPTSGEADRTTLADRLLTLGCLDFGMDSPSGRIARAGELLADHPEVADASVYSMAAVGDHDGLRQTLRHEPDAASREGGPHGWPPLLYAAYSRIVADRPTWSTLKAARVLLDAGADPNVGYLWRGNVPPFTALTGAFGHGEQDEPPHLHAFELARLLLDHGADPNDGQALYNNGLAGTARDDTRHLELLLEFGLGTDCKGPWYARLGGQLRPPQELLYDELEVAATRGLPNRMALLIRQGLDLSRPVGRRQLPPVRLAAENAHRPILDLLATAGVTVDLSVTEQFVITALTGTKTQLRQWTDRHPGLLDELRQTHPALVQRAASRGRTDMIPALIDLGLDIDARSGGSGTTALHHAASTNDLELAKTLIGLGADPDITDAHVEATPLGWAEHSRNNEVADYLRPLTRPDG